MAQVESRGSLNLVAKCASETVKDDVDRPRPYTRFVPGLHRTCVTLRQYVNDNRLALV